jgi:hypothetical protein
MIDTDRAQKNSIGSVYSVANLESMDGSKSIINRVSLGSANLVELLCASCWSIRAARFSE